MQSFIDQFGENITGVIHGFDRLIFRGTLMGIASLDQLNIWLSSQRILYKDYVPFVERLSTLIKERAKEIAAEHNRPYIYLNSPNESKKDRAEAIMRQDKIKEGLVCVFACVEPCKTFCVSKNRKLKKLILTPQNRQCLHLYFYFNDKRFGLMHIRLQSWIPFTIQIYLNGREYLAHRLDHANISYTKLGNCFTEIANIDKAQTFISELETKPWQNFLSLLARRVNPLMDQRRRLNLNNYYWTVKEAEYATDVIFRNRAALAKVYEPLVHHAIKHLGSRDILRFLGKTRPSHFRGDSNGTLVHRPEGICIKFRVDENSIKMYDKEGIVLRIETTINNPRRFKVWRKNRKRQYAWLPMRRGIADIPRRVELMHAANERFLEALSVVAVPTPAKVILEPIAKRASLRGQSVRAINPVSKNDAALFSAIYKGGNLANGFRNRDVIKALCSTAYPNVHIKPGQLTHRLRILRAHQLITKVPRTNLYRITQKGQHVLTATLTLRETPLQKLAA